MSEYNITISVPVQAPESKYEGDICIMDHFLECRIKRLTPEDQAALSLIARNLECDISDSLRQLRTDTHTLQTHLLQHDVIWASDITIPKQGSCRGDIPTNRAIRPIFARSHTGRAADKWVWDLLRDTPGLFSPRPACEFMLGPLKVPESGEIQD